jgi:BTB And C-terminal Kelch
LELETKEALDSSDWLNISAESILEFLNMECLNINEADLVQALIRWGKFQLELQVDNLDENLRSKILPGLRKIRFGSLTQQEIVQLCQDELGKVLSAEEKCSIFMSIMSENWSLMPNEVVSSTKLTPRTPRHEPYTFCSLPFTADQNKIETRCGNNYGGKIFAFKVDQNAEILGVKLNLTAPYHKLITFSLSNSDEYENVVIATGSVNITSPLDRGEVFCPFNTKQTLVANEWYRVEFQFNGFDESCCHCGYVFPSDKSPGICDGLTLTINSGFTLCVHVLGIVFSKAVDK